MSLDPQALQAALEAQMADQPFSGALLIREGGETILAAAYGHAQIAEAIPNTIDTRFATASGCKIFTAVAALQLIEAGKFTLDTPVSDLVEIDYPLDPAITVRHLLTHTSGMPDYYDEELMSDEDCIALVNTYPVYTWETPRDYIRLFPERPQKFPPGERFNYNNGAFVLLALIVEEHSGQPFPQVITDRVFTPAGMTDSGYFRMDALPARTAYGYIREDDGTLRTNIYALPVIGSGDGGAFVTAPDWARFWDALYGFKLLSESTTSAMLTPQIDTGHDTLDKHYGLGIWLTLRDGAMHERYVVGGDFGVGMVSVRFPQYDVEATILDNIGDGVWGLWGALVKHLDAQAK
jgi:CubicO group peptidase (beta-lactamase class C family)